MNLLREQPLVCTFNAIEKEILEITPITTLKNHLNLRDARLRTSTFFEVGSEFIRVCKHFYTGTLLISAKPVYTVHSNMDKETGTPSPDGKGRKQYSKVCDEQKQFVFAYILSFKTIVSHYCRKTTKKQYLESTLQRCMIYTKLNALS